MAARLELGLGAQEVLSVPGAGQVVGVYSRAAWLRLPGGLVALTTFDVPSGPVHARTAVGLDRLRVDDKVVVTTSLLQAGALLVDLVGAQPWQGEVPAAAGLEAGRRMVLGLLRQAPRPALDPDVLQAAVGALERGDLTGVISLLGGVGPGLTPAGDDCLAGILLIAKVRLEGRATSELTDAASQVRTNDISRTFLKWAGRGQSIEPVHRLLISASYGRVDPARAALTKLLGFGHSSGADLACGLRLGLEHLRFPVPPTPSTGPGGRPVQALRR